MTLKMQLLSGETHKNSSIFKYHTQSSVDLSKIRWIFSFQFLELLNFMVHLAQKEIEKWWTLKDWDRPD